MRICTKYENSNTNRIYTFFLNITTRICGIYTFFVKYHIYADYTDSQNENFFFLQEPIYPFLKALRPLILKKEKKINSAMQFFWEG